MNTWYWIFSTKPDGRICLKRYKELESAIENAFSWPEPDTRVVESSAESYKNALATGTVVWTKP